MGRAPCHKNAGKKNHKWSFKAQRKRNFARPHADVLYEKFHDAAARGEDAQPPLPAGGQRAENEVDEDLPGLGQFYCAVTGRHFESADALARHQRTKEHKRRLKRLLNDPAPHSQADADAAAGKGKPDNGPRLRPQRAPAAKMDT